MQNNNINKALAIVGDASRYQMIMLIYFTLLWFQLTYLLLGSPYIFMNPVFKCSFSDDAQTEALACPRLSQCILVNDFTLTGHVQLYCEYQTQRNLIQACIYIGSIIGLLIVNPTADVVGRRVIFIFAQMLSNVGIIGLIVGGYCKSMPLLAVSQIFIGCGSYSTMITGYIFISDLCEDSVRQKGILSMNGVWAVAQTTFFFLYNWYNQWYNFLIIIVLIPNLGMLLFSLFFIVQTPIFLMTKKKDRQACLASLEKIAIFNNRATPEIMQEVEELVGREYQLKMEENVSQQETSLFDIFKEKKYVKIILLVAVVEISTNMYYYGVQFSLDQVGTNFGYNILLSGIIETVSYFSSSTFSSITDLFITKMPRRKSLFLFNALAIVVGSLFLIGPINNSQIAATIMLGVCRYINTYSQAVIPLLQNESFPPKYQATGWGFIEGISQAGNFVTPFIVSLATNLEVNPILIFCVTLAVLGLLPIKFIRETLPRKKGLEELGEFEDQKFEDQKLQDSLISNSNVN